MHVAKTLTTVCHVLVGGSSVSRLKDRTGGTIRDLSYFLGTFRFEMRCRECGETGHKDFQCPLRAAAHFAGIQCKKCGDRSHVTQVCFNVEAVKELSHVWLSYYLNAYLISRNAQNRGLFAASTTECCCVFDISRL